VETDREPAESRRVRTVGRVLTVLALAATFVATLTPLPGNVVAADFWCVTCGELGSLDFAANIVMFMPVGLALALATGRRWRTVAICVAVTMFIEAMQVRVVAGRDSSLGDLIANTLGGWLGAEIALMWRTVVWPRPSVAKWLALSWSAALALIGLLTSFGLRPAHVSSSLWVQWTPVRTSYTPFTGQLLKFDINGINLVAPFPPSSVGGEITGEPWRATATVSRAGLAEQRSVIVRVADETMALLSIEQRGSDLSCYQKTRSGDFRFRSLRVALPNALRAGSSSAEPTRLTCSRANKQLIAGQIDGSEPRAEAVRLSPAWGWLLVSPFDLPAGRRFLWIGVLWLMALGFPSGFWVARARGSSAAPRSVALPITAALAALGVVLVLAPTIAATALGAPWEWLSALGGVAIGVALARVVPNHVTESPDRAR
jgi:hypothetical protein